MLLFTTILCKNTFHVSLLEWIIVYLHKQTKRRRSFMLGSVSEAITRTAPCDVLIVRSE